jgi:hypothetical protein
LLDTLATAQATALKCAFFILQLGSAGRVTNIRKEREYKRTI